MQVPFPVSPVWMQVETAWVANIGSMTVHRAVLAALSVCTAAVVVVTLFQTDKRTFTVTTESTTEYTVNVIPAPAMVP